MCAWPIPCSTKKRIAKYSIRTTDTKTRLSQDGGSSAAWQKLNMRPWPTRRMTNTIFRFFGLFLLVLTVSACTELPYNNLDNGHLKTLLEQGVPIYDIRRPEEWRQTGVIEGSRLLTFVDAGGRVLPDFLTRFAD